ELRFETGYELGSGDEQHQIRDSTGHLLAQFDDNWEFNRARSALLTKKQHAASAVVMIFASSPAASTRPSASTTTQWAAAFTAEELGLPRRGATTPSLIDLAFYRAQRQACIECWESLLAKGTQVSVPEPIVNDAWRALIIAQHTILAGDQMNYSAGNQYARQYANESGDSIRSLMFFGYRDAARRA